MMMSWKQGIVVGHAIAITLLCLTVMSWQSPIPKELPLANPSPHANMGLFSVFMDQPAEWSPAALGS
jgi:hypothetical protein